METRPMSRRTMRTALAADRAGKTGKLVDTCRHEGQQENKTNSEEISDIKVQIYGNTAIATYKSTYDPTYDGEHCARTILSTAPLSGRTVHGNKLRATALN